MSGHYPEPALCVCGRLLDRCRFGQLAGVPDGVTLISDHEPYDVLPGIPDVGVAVIPREPR